MFKSCTIFLDKNFQAQISQVDNYYSLLPIKEFLFPQGARAIQSWKSLSPGWQDLYPPAFPHPSSLASLSLALFFLILFFCPTVHNSSNCAAHIVTPLHSSYHLLNTFYVLDTIHSQHHLILKRAMKKMSALFSSNCMSKQLKFIEAAVPRHQTSQRRAKACGLIPEIAKEVISHASCSELCGYLEYLVEMDSEASSGFSGASAGIHQSCLTWSQNQRR